CQQYNSYHPTF
nr:immunoglobulin light chain junction region [Macaca mulatta]